MKLTIYGLTIMAILPLFYLGWGKKRGRLILGIIILTIVAAGLFFPGEITYSILAREIEKEIKNKEIKTDDIINSAANQKVDSENSEKIGQAKKIVELNKKIKKLETLCYKEKTETNLQNGELNKIFREKAKQAGVSKGSQKKFLSVLLFCGKEFNDKLASIEYKIGGGEIKSKITTENAIDFANYRDSKPEIIKEKIFDIIKKTEAEKKHLYHYNDFSIIGFKNIDQITGSELRQGLLEIFDPQKDIDFGKHKDKDNNEINPDLLRLIFVITTSNSNPEYLNDYKQKLRHIEPILDKYFGTIIFSSTGIEIIIFLLLIRNKKKSENKALKNFGY